ncbi:uncharacterized protein LOC141902638 [Tubulanus polymorphus]|uniref:uncharacterized protein LOC141902638 n=1 Tax=Tubulanus polymorphus TaxID=672921 RepID=UPI003DA54960
MEEPKQEKKKEAAVLSLTSLANISRELGNGLVVGMYLNIPTTTLVNFKITKDQEDQTDKEMAQKTLFYWKEMRGPAKDREKVHDLEKALREMGKNEWAEAFMERYRNQQEITLDFFNSIG